MKQIMVITLVICCFLTACNKENIITAPEAADNGQQSTTAPDIVDSSNKETVIPDARDSEQDDSIVLPVIVPPATVPPEVDLDKNDGGLVAIYFCNTEEVKKNKVVNRHPSELETYWVENVLKFPEEPHREVYFNQQGAPRLTYYVSDQYHMNEYINQQGELRLTYYDSDQYFSYDEYYEGNPFSVEHIPKWDESRALIINNPGVTWLDPYPLVDSLKQLKEDRPDVLLMSNRPFELVDKNIETVDVVVFDDEVAIGKRMVEYAYAQKADAFVYYYVSTEERPVPGDELRMAAAKSKCDELGLTFVPELIDSVSPPIDEAQINFEDVNKKVAKYGKKTAFTYYYKESALNFWLNPFFIWDTDEVFKDTKYAIHIWDPSVRQALSEIYNNPKVNNPFDYRRGFEEHQYYLEGGKSSRNYDTKALIRSPVDMDVLYVSAMSRYALAYADGNTVLKKANKEFFRYCLQEAMAELGFPECNVYVNTYEEYGDNCFFISTDFITIY